MLSGIFNTLFAWVRCEFKAIVSFESDNSSMMDGWQSWKEKIIKFAKIESVTRPMIKKLLEGLEECDELPYPHGQHFLLLPIM